MPELLVLSAADVRRLLDVDRLGSALRTAFVAVTEGRASVPPRGGATTADGFLGAMPGYVPELGLAAKLVAYFGGNEARGLPSHNALIAVFDPATGVPLAVMDGTYITAVRTAAAALVAAQALARPDPAVITVVGAGVQGAAHLELFARAYPGSALRVVSRTPDRAEALAATHSRTTAVHGFVDAVTGADIVCLCTDSPDPVVARDAFAPGTHIGSVGSGVEVDARTVADAMVFVESRAVATSPFPAGSRELAGMSPDDVTEVGEVLLGRRPGRTSADQLTLYKSMGHAVEDVAAATLVLAAARESGAGTKVTL